MMAALASGKGFQSEPQPGARPADCPPGRRAAREGDVDILAYDGSLLS
jgi:hypothetical protein